MTKIVLRTDFGSKANPAPKWRHTVHDLESHASSHSRDNSLEKRCRAKTMDKFQGIKEKSNTSHIKDAIDKEDKTKCNSDSTDGQLRELLNKLTNKEYKIENETKLNIKYNDTIDEEQYRELGDLLSTHRMSLRAACNITDGELTSFFKGFKKRKLRELDLSCSKNLTTTGFQEVAQFVKMRGVGTLKLGGCKLSTKHVEVIHAELFSKQNSVRMLEELDISYNPTLQPDDYIKIGEIVKEYKVKKLRLTGCKLSNSHLEKFESIEHLTVDTVDMGDNTSISKGIVMVAKIVKKWNVKELNISGCMLTKGQLEMFKDGLVETQICRLNLSDYDRRPDEAYIKEVCELLSFVTEVLYLQFKGINASCRRLLQGELNKLTKRETKIILQKETITWKGNVK